MYDYQAGQTYSFQTYAPSVLGDGFQNILIQGVMTADVAAALGFDYVAQHRIVYPFVKAADPSIVNDPTQFTYLRCKSISGTPVIIAAEWINESTITTVATKTLYITIPNTLDSEVPGIQAAIIAQGKSNMTLELK